MQAPLSSVPRKTVTIDVWAAPFDPSSQYFGSGMDFYCYYKIRFKTRHDVLEWLRCTALVVAVVGGLIIGFLFYQFEHHFQPSHFDPVPARQKMFDLAICLVLWFSAVFIWQLIPQQDSYFAPGPYPPNGEFYPYSDAVTYDLSAELAVIGQGLSEQDYVDKPVYTWILFILHRLSGNKFGLCFVFTRCFDRSSHSGDVWIGRAIHSRSAGLPWPWLFCCTKRMQ